MTAFEYSDIVERFFVEPRNKLTFLTPIVQLDGLLAEESQQPENAS